MEKVQKDSLLDVLLYLFEHYAEADQAGAIHQVDELSEDLLQAGFDHREIKRALAWLDELQISLGHFNQEKASSTGALRFYSIEESMRITEKARDYLLYLERLGFIDVFSRELIIDRAMTLEHSIVDVNEIKWLALTVLLTQPSKRDKLAHLEALVLNEHGYVRH